MSTNKLTYSTEMMVNFKQVNVVSPQKKFQALQTADGFSLLFSISTNGIFYLTEQLAGDSTGWQQIDLSSDLKTAHAGAAVTAKNFAVSQNLESGKLDMALAITVGGKDYLYLSLNNESKTGSITAESVMWTVMPYDDPAHPNLTLAIENIYIADTKREEYIVVDISRKNYAKPSDFLDRYYIDSKKAKGRYWNNMVMGGDLDPGITSRLGRKAGDRVDGIYTLGSINGTTELLYAPLYNPWSPDAPPTVTRLQVPQGATALAVTDVGNNATDLFVAANKSLYYFAAGKQDDGAAGWLIQTNDLFEGVTDLFAFSTDDRYVVWGLNRADQIFYTSCLKQNVTIPAQWTFPMPILTGVDQVSPYINAADSANTFFAVAGNSLKKVTQSPQTSIWDFQDIVLKAPVEAKATRYSSYTTRIALTDANDQPLAKTALNLSSNSRVPVYINHLYYVITDTPIPVYTDASGSITIVEQLEDIAGARFTVTDASGAHAEINPMDKPFNKLAALDSSDKLKGANIVRPDGSTKKLVAADVNESDLKAVAAANVNLAKAYTAAATTSGRKRGLMLMAMPTGHTMQLQGFGNTILADVGDIFRWLESGVDYVWHLVEDAATGFWRFVVTIAGKVYQGILDCVEKVVSAVRWVYNLIKTAIEDLIKYLEFLFEWKDITRTKQVIKNITKLYLKNEIDQIEVVKGKFNDEIQNLVKTINNWAGITDWKGLGAAATSPANASSKPNSGQDAPGNLLSSHFQNNSNNIVQKNRNTWPTPGQTPIDTLLLALKNEGTILDSVIDQFSSLANSYQQMNLEDILKRVVAIIADGVLETVENVVDALFDIVYELATAALNLLDTPIYIPVVSDILEYFGVPSLSMLDLFCWITAVPVTIGYKITRNTAPFGDDQFSNLLINATSFAQIVDAFRQPPRAMMVEEAGLKLPTDGGGSDFALDSDLDAPPTMAAPAVTAGPITMPKSVSSAVYVTGHTASGFFTLMSCFVSSFEAADESPENDWGIPSAILGVLSAATNGIAGVLVPKYPIENKVVSWMSTATTGTVILCKLIFSGPAQTKFGAATGVMKNLKAGDGRATGAVVNTILIIPALVCTCWHFYELAQKDASAERSAAIIDETSNMTSYISRISYCVAVNDKEPETKAIAVGVMVVANVCTAGLQTAEAIVGA
ncbi:hypothetical protein [Polluticoccus soli]|uniref:hypothetical protein n=1 Tax=Polluticoccus soli TaxID=3034150 RepID=UPI0023E2F3E6|nr:hypothetical protein [Flavipsychrobacter sp. JY13-12]